jgi:predicted TIM-barrel fold metal-dependent hydrolase
MPIMPMKSMEVQRRVFDAHFHLGTWGTRRYFEQEIQPMCMPGRAAYAPGTEHRDPQDCLRYFEAYGLAGGIATPNYVAPDPRYSLIDLNTMMCEGVHQIASLYGAIFASPISADMPFTREALGRCDHPKIRAMKLTATNWPPCSPDPETWTSEFTSNMEELLECARDRHLVLQFHTGFANSQPQDFDRFLHQYGEGLSVHFAHSGEAVWPSFQFVALFPQWLTHGFDVYGDTSLCPGFVMPWLIRELERVEGGMDRILFATDSPWGVLPAEYWKIECLDVPDETKDRIFFDNAARLYDLDALR